MYGGAPDLLCRHSGIQMNKTRYEAPMKVDAPVTNHVEYGRQDGRIVYFVVLLLYYVSGVPGTGDPMQVVGFDHDRRGQRTPHNVLDDGLHMDVYRNGEKYRVVTDFPPVYSAEDALSTAIQHTRTNAATYVTRFESHHDV